ncbi:MAG: hypothetical protein V8Q71_02280 [Bacilli bacterium]
MIEEKNIIAWKNFNHLSFIDCACAVTAKSSGKRAEMKTLLTYLERYNKDVKKRLFTSANNVNLNTVLGYHRDSDFYSKYD